MNYLLFICIAISALQPAYAFWGNKNSEDVKQLNLSNVADDYQKNKARYAINWRNKYVLYKGRIGDIWATDYKFAPQSVYLNNTRVDVSCVSVKDKPNIIAQYNPGDMVSVIGKYDQMIPIDSVYMIQLEDCIIQ